MTGCSLICCLPPAEGGPWVQGAAGAQLHHHLVLAAGAVVVEAHRGPQLGTICGPPHQWSGDIPRNTPGTQLPPPHRQQALTGIWPVTEGAVFAPWAVMVGVGGLGQQSGMVRAGYAPTPHVRAEKGALLAVGEGIPPQCTGRAPGTRTAMRCAGRPAPAPAT